jgi:O-antigen ligase
MNTAKFEATLLKLLLVGPAFVSLFLVINSVSDPVNAPKMAALGSLGFALSAMVIGPSIKRSWTESKYLLLTLGLFFLGMVNSILNSNSPLSQNLYGVYGRNTGFVTYISLIFVLIGALQAREIRTLKYLIYGFLFVGIINFIYCGWAILFGDFIPWNNPYKNILGLFGNPDFISAFLGMFISSLVSFLVIPRNKIWVRCIAVSISIVAFVEIVKSHAIQGIAVTALGAGIVALFIIRAKIKSNLGWLTYLVAAISAGILGILGTLQIGPLSFIYKKSVSLRGSYWHAGINMGNDHPFTGVGMDSYGDSYKASRPAVALIDTPGPKVISNAAHNVFVDIFAYGGWPLFLSYIGIFVIVLVSIVRVLKRSRNFEPIFVTLTVIWATYIVQSIISINQIGLAIWGWVTSGALIAYEIMTRESNFRAEAQTPNSKRKIGRKNEEFITPSLTAGIGLLVGLFIAIPPLSADLKWKSALDSRDIKNVEAAMIPSYLNPASSFKYGSVVSLLSENGFNDAAYKYAKIAVVFNPDFSDAWRQLYSLPQSTAKEKNEALQNIKRLDPNNPDPLGLKP